LIPGLTGLGMAGRAAAHADDIARAGKGLDKALDMARAACSFSAETSVATEDGPVAIGDIDVGDRVLAYDEVLGTTGSYTVTAILMHRDPAITYLTIDGEQIETTPEHPFFTEERTWVPASELLVGDHVVNADGSSGTVERVQIRLQMQHMYNLTVADAHTFFVGDGEWLVHNTCKPRGPKMQAIDAAGKARSPYPIGKRYTFNTKKEAYEAANRAGPGKPVNHPRGEHGPHYHPGDSNGKPLNHDHYNYPKHRR
jgi:hypothetical protein